MPLPPAETPLYNHPLPLLEAWLQAQGCQQHPQDRHCWFLDRSGWQADLYLEIDQLSVCYRQADGSPDIHRAFKYSLSRQDVEAAVLAGP